MRAESLRTLLWLATSVCTLGCRCILQSAGKSRRLASGERGGPDLRSARGLQSLRDLLLSLRRGGERQHQATATGAAHLGADGPRLARGIDKVVELRAAHAETQFCSGSR